MKNRRIISELIGLIGAVENNGKTENTDKIVREALISEDSDEMVNRIREEKYKLSPGCCGCESPCGNTSGFDMDEFDKSPEEIKALKLRVLDTVIRLAGANEELHPETYRALSYMRYDLTEDTYIKLLEDLE